MYPMKGKKVQKAVLKLFDIYFINKQKWLPQYFDSGLLSIG